jgi:hypothetical protein
MAREVLTMVRWAVVAAAVVSAAAACTPAPTPSGNSVTNASVAGGAGVECVITGSRQLRCRGAVPGDGSTEAGSWVSPSGVPSAYAVATGSTPGFGILGQYPGAKARCAVALDRDLYCWGKANYDPDAWDTLTPQAVTGVGSARGVSVSSGSDGTLHACAATTAGAAHCWGANGSGQLGDGTVTSSGLAAVSVSGLATGVADVVAAGAYSCALTTSGAVKCWGAGYGTTPVGVPGLTSGVTAISAAEDHACAIVTGGVVKCWGSNAQGQLGDGTTTDSAVPVDVVGVAGATAVSAVKGSTMALMPAATPVTLWYWGGAIDQPLLCPPTCGVGPLTAVPALGVPLNLLGAPASVAKVSGGSQAALGVMISGWSVIASDGDVYTALAPGTSGPIFMLTTVPL